ncbi:MAG TPA: cytochrome c oxidase assembly protein [Solirubrobacteraceae bacterium]|jgi:cytochrome c oxidase assembly factor CtaG|nr:cytochrome c oxidase assembly protein [Solirubrobacteraceae bacterium]
MAPQLPPPLASASVSGAIIQLGPLAVLCALYARRAHTLSKGSHRVPGWRQACFYGGCLVIAAALSGLGGESQELLYAHMIEHLLLGDIAALLIVLGLTGPLLAPVLRIGIFDRLRALAHPAVAFPLWALDLYLWHLPVFYEAALRHDAVHALEHAMFVGFGVNMWMCLFGPLPMPSWFGNLGRLIYIIAVRLAGTVLGNLFLWSGTVFYPFYSHGEAGSHISPLTDQSIAGAIMMVEESFLTLGLFCWLFLRAAREGEERQDLLDLAAARGVELSEQRAARAVAAGRGADLRRRIESGAGSPERAATHEPA